MCGGPGSAASGSNDDGNTTIVHDSDGETVITQSGDPAQAEVHIDREPGRTIYRRSGGNTAIVTQSSRGALLERVPDWLKKLPEQ
jgi:hypothetical protein